jgi:hypothetical protein
MRTNRALLIVVALLGTGLGFAQEKEKKVDADKPDMTLTGDEKFTIRTDEAAVLAAKVDRQDAQTRLDNAQDQLNQDLAKLYQRHKISQTEVAFCDGPSQVGPCASVPRGEFSLRPIPKPKAEAKQPEKK